MTYRTLIARVHPFTRMIARHVLEPTTRYLVGKPGAWEQFATVSDAIRYHAIATGSSADFVHVRVDHTAPMKSGRLTLIGHVAADGDKQGSARGSMPDYGKGETRSW